MSEKVIETTNTCGYYNGNRWPIQLVISSLNVTLHLQPGEYIKDRAGRKINDPFFETYAKNRQLFRETSGTAVPVIRVPQAGTKANAVHDGHSVRQVTQFTHTPAGIRVPVVPQPKAVPQQTINKNSVQAMSVEEARARGFAHRTREVPEDYGLTDTDQALPPRLPPPIKIATDVRPSKNTTLPAGLLEAATSEVPEGRTSLVTALNKSKPNVPPPEEQEESAGFLNTITQNAPPDSPVVAGPAAAAPRPRVAPALPVRQPVDEETAQIEEALQEPAVPEPPVEEEETAPPLPTPRPIRAVQPSPATAPRPITPRNKFLCVECELGFPFRSQLARHAALKHPDKVSLIMGPYPEGT